MINFENMTVAQMKHYLKTGALQKLDNAELGQLLSASRGIRDHFAKERGLDASLETAYWNAAEKEIVREFRNRNISVTVMTFADVYSSLNELLKSGNREAKTATRKIISQYDTAALLDIKAELMTVPDCQKLFGEVLKLFDEQIGAALS